jgi:hypothetical protein
MNVQNMDNVIGLSQFDFSFLPVDSRLAAISTFAPSLFGCSKVCKDPNEFRKIQDLRFLHCFEP